MAYGGVCLLRGMPYEGFDCSSWRIDPRLCGLFGQWACLSGYSLARLSVFEIHGGMEPIYSILVYFMTSVGHCRRSMIWRASRIDKGIMLPSVRTLLWKAGLICSKFGPAGSFAEICYLIFKIQYVNSLFTITIYIRYFPYATHQNHDSYWWRSPTLLGPFVLAVAHSEHAYIPIPFILLAYFWY